MVNIDSELELVMLKKNLMITPRILHLNFEFKAEIRAGKKQVFANIDPGYTRSIF